MPEPRRTRIRSVRSKPSKEARTEFVIQRRHREIVCNHVLDLFLRDQFGELHYLVHIPTTVNTASTFVEPALHVPAIVLAAVELSAKILAGNQLRKMGT
ncbi:unnamed protein product [Linum trigynum]|uniref:Uncharacterized protein n=1 Tax=Linum trigynum TaxID=586398 RepID=A0AAV2F5A5_9ROSI